MTASSAEAGARFAAVIVNYNGGAMLEECVKSVLDEGVSVPRVFVVDNGSRDGSDLRLAQRFPDLVLIKNHCNAGFARAVNQGIRCACADSSAIDFLLLLNNDAQLETGALQAFADGFTAHPDVAIAGGQLRYPDGRLQSAFAPLPSALEESVPLPILRLFSASRFQRKTHEESAKSVECVLGACLCVRASVLPRLGLLDEDYFFFFEEIEWCQRARRLGMEVFYLPRARALHRGGQTANRSRGPARVEYQRSKLTFFRKTRSGSAYFVVSAVLVIRTLINALFSGALCVMTLFLNRRIRIKAQTYWYLFAWNVLMRPKSWGLPDKCPGQIR